MLIFNHSYFWDTYIIHKKALYRRGEANRYFRIWKKSIYDIKIIIFILYHLLWNKFPQNKIDEANMILPANNILNDSFYLRDKWKKHFFWPSLEIGKFSIDVVGGAIHTLTTLAENDNATYLHILLHQQISIVRTKMKQSL